MTDRNTAHLAGEFLVAGELARKGYLVSITMGNAKAIDIFASTERAEKITFDVKAARTKSWVTGDIEDTIDFYIFVYLGTQKQIYRNERPQFFLARPHEIKQLVKTYGAKKTMKDISYRALANKEFQERWDKLPPP